MTEVTLTGDQLFGPNFGMDSTTSGPAGARLTEAAGQGTSEVGCLT
jgi:hypothetical protein